MRSAKTGGKPRPRETEPVHAYVTDNGEPTHVLVSIDEYERLIKIDLVQDAVAQIERCDDDFVDADKSALELAANELHLAWSCNQPNRMRRWSPWPPQSRTSLSSHLRTV